MYCPPQPCQPQYQPLPLSTGTVGIDRCGNIEVYAAPRVVRRPVSWQHWPICPSFVGWSNSGVSWDSGGGWGGGSWWSGMPSVSPYGAGNLAAVLTGGAALAAQMIAARPARPARPALVPARRAA